VTAVSQLEEASARADQLITDGLDRDDLALITEAVAEYSAALQLAAPGSWKHAEIAHNMGAALCLIAQRTGERQRKFSMLKMAGTYLQTAMEVRTRQAAPEAWALSQANVALVHLTRFEFWKDRVDLMVAYIAIEDALEIFDDTANWHWFYWAKEIQAYLQSLRARILKL